MSLSSVMKKYLGDALAWECFFQAKQRAYDLKGVKHLQILQETCYDALILFGMTTIHKLENCDPIALKQIQDYINIEYKKRLEEDRLL